MIIIIIRLKDKYRMFCNKTRLSQYNEKIKKKLPKEIV